MVSAVALVLCLAAPGAVKATQEIGQFHVYRRVDPAVHARTGPVYDAFERFFAAYAQRMSDKSTSDRPSGWDFWVVLRPDPKKDNRPHVLVVASSGGLTVRIADIHPAPGLNLDQEAAKAVRDSIRTILDPFFNELASGKGAAHRMLVRERNR